MVLLTLSENSNLSGMEKIGLFFGSFNPVHIGHLILANHFAENSDLDNVWMVVTPQNPFKQNQRLLANHHRLELIYQATLDYPLLQPSDIEFQLPTPNYTCNTLVHLEEKYPNKKFILIMGEDNLQSFPKWKNYEVILERYEIYVYPRSKEGKVIDSLLSHPKIQLIDAPRIELSSSMIRQMIQEGKNIRPLMPFESWEYLREMNFYK